MPIFARMRVLLAGFRHRPDGAMDNSHELGGGFMHSEGLHSGPVDRHPGYVMTGSAKSSPKPPFMSRHQFPRTEPIRQTSATNDFPALLQVGALPVRFEKGETEILLLASRETKRWVIPKGWPMKGIKNWAAAAQEAREEAGIIGKARKKPIGSFLYFKRRRPISIYAALRCMSSITKRGSTIIARKDSEKRGVVFCRGSCQSRPGNWTDRAVARFRPQDRQEIGA